MPGATHEDPSEVGSIGLSDLGDSIDTTTFEQILEMDDDEDEREFSSGIVFDFFSQAETTFEKMDANLQKQDLEQVSALGHFLKGSSATLGLVKVKDSCEKIQHLGGHKDETGSREEPNTDVLLAKLRSTIAEAKHEFTDAKKVLMRFYRKEPAAD